VGNVAEWVTGATEPSSQTYSAASVASVGAFLKGGDFMNATVPCRATRAIRARFYRSFPVGFRCCANPIVSPSGPRPATEVPTEAGH
jgi:formylglycine-generating enzyme required for sulfatase activity